MEKYKRLLQEIKKKGTWKGEARENMPRTLSLFGYQFRHDLSQGFPLLTTKKLYWKGIVAELLWFLRGDTNIKFLLDNDSNFWNEDAYNYYLKQIGKNSKGQFNIEPMSLEEFIKRVKDNKNYEKSRVESNDYKLGDCGMQYGKLWREWENLKPSKFPNPEPYQIEKIDQFVNLIKGLKYNPMGRRHIITAWNPATLDKMALNACHTLVQFNCRPLTEFQRKTLLSEKPEWEGQFHMIDENPSGDIMETIDAEGIPKYYIDCQMYQRSADVFLGVPFNIASYALLTHIVAKICNMVPGDYIHTFGDVHIYENHMEQVDLQLTREPRLLPYLKVNDFINWKDDFDAIFYNLDVEDFMEEFKLTDYNPHPAIKAPLSTGLKT